MSVEDWRFIIRNNISLARIAEVEAWTGAELYPRFNEIGNFLLTVPMDSRVSDLLVKQNGIVAMRGDTPIMSGSILTRKVHWTGDGGQITVAGRDDNRYLSDRLAYPVPLGPPYSTSEYDARSGVASTVMRDYVLNNLGASALAQRRKVGLILPVDPVIGLTVNGRGRFQPLSELLRELALAGGALGFRMIQTTSGLEFQVYQPVDRTDTAVFSPLLGTLTEYDYTEEGGNGNYVIVGGKGAGTARAFKEKGDSAAIVNYERIEFFRDRRDSNLEAELNQTADEELAKNAEKRILNISPVESDYLRYPDNFSLGDIVSTVLVKDYGDMQVEVDFEYQDIIREVQIKIDSSGTVVRPVIGTSESRAIAEFNFERQAEKRISNLERQL